MKPGNFRPQVNIIVCRDRFQDFPDILRRRFFYSCPLKHPVELGLYPLGGRLQPLVLKIIFEIGRQSGNGKPANDSDVFFGINRVDVIHPFSAMLVGIQPLFSCDIDFLRRNRNAEITGLLAHSSSHRRKHQDLAGVPFYGLENSHGLLHFPFKVNQRQKGVRVFVFLYAIR